MDTIFQSIWYSQTVLIYSSKVISYFFPKSISHFNFKEKYEFNKSGFTKYLYVSIRSICFFASFKYPNAQKLSAILS